VIETAQYAVQPPRSPASVVLLRTLIVICLASDFLMVPVLSLVPWRPMPIVPLLLAIVGCVLAQGCLLAAWLAWSEQPFRQRLIWHWIVAAILYLVWAAGLALGQPRHFAQSSIMVGLLVPLVSIGAQLPLWIARQTFGWRLIRGDANNDTGPAPLAIRDLMLATALIAVALALARSAPSPDAKPIGPFGVIIALVASAISTITLLPASVLLRPAHPFPRGIRLAYLYAAFWIGLPWMIVFVAWHRGLFPAPPLPVLIGLSCLILSFASTVVLAAATARAHGYRLLSGRLPGPRDPFLQPVELSPRQELHPL
jgi:hypothetical protein